METMKIEKTKKCFVQYVWLHFMLNFFGETFTGPRMDLIIWFAVLYIITALVFLLWHKNNKKLRNDDLSYEVIYEVVN